MSAQQLQPAERAFAREHFVDFCMIAVIACATIAWALLCGKDINFDQIHYHFYLGHNLFHDRLQQDFMPANGQSYLNPLAYAPFYLMVASEWHSLAIASLLAALHSINVVLAYFLVKRVLPVEWSWARAIAALGAVLAFLSPVFLNEVGTSFADVTTSALVLGAALAGLSSHRSTWWRDPSLMAGLLMGAACALKLSNVVFGPACAVLVFIMQSRLSDRLRSTLLLGVGALTGFLAGHAYWGARLWKAIGNPVFPFFQDYFQTDILPKEGANLERFLPDSVLDSLLLPFRMVQPRSWIYIESVSPDLRFAALFLLAVAAVIAALWMRSRSQRVQPAVVPALAARRITAVSAFFLLSYALWQWTSGNGRYGLMVSILCGPMVAIAAYVLLRAWRPIAITLIGLIALQLIHLQSANLRWGGYAPWTSTWYDQSIPKRLVDEPYLYVSVGNNSNSFIYPYLHPASAFTNPLGQTALDLDGPGGRQLKSLFARHRGNVRFLAVTPSGKGDWHSAWVARIDTQIARLGFGVDATDCEMILVSGPIENGQDFDAADPPRRTLGSCRLYERPFAYAEERQQVTKIARQVVEWCPKLFKPAYTLMERSQDAWSAAYPSTDSMLVIKDGSIYGTFTRASADIFIGTVETWQRGIRPKCESFPDKPRDAYNFE